MAKILDLYLSRERGEIKMPPYWWRPTESQFMWALDILSKLNLSVSDTGDGSHDGARDTVIVDGWTVDTDDDGVWAREGESMWLVGTKDDTPVSLDELPNNVRAVVFFMGAYRASWWPGGSNYQTKSAVFQIQRVIAPMFPPAVQKFIFHHTGGV